VLLCGGTFCLRVSVASGREKRKTIDYLAEKQTQHKLQEGQAIVMKINGQRVKAVSHNYFLSYNFNATCFGLSTQSHNQAKLEYQIKVTM
jgi:hypothetical protein